MSWYRNIDVFIIASYSGYKIMRRHTVPSRIARHLRESRDNLADRITEQRIEIATLNEQLRAKDKEIELLKQLIDELKYDE